MVSLPNPNENLLFGYSRSGCFRVRHITEHREYSVVRDIDTERLKVALQRNHTPEKLLAALGSPDPKEDQFYVSRFKGDRRGKIIHVDIRRTNVPPGRVRTKRDNPLP
jgi:hypothetical protein